MPREYRLDPYGDVARAGSMFGGSDMGRIGLSGNGWSVTPTLRSGYPGFRFRSSFAEGGAVEGESPLMNVAQQYDVEPTAMATSLPMPTQPGFPSPMLPPPTGAPRRGMDRDQRKAFNEMRRNYGINQPMPTRPGFPFMLPRDPGYGMPTSLTPKTGIGSLLQQSDLYQSLFGNGTAAPAPAATPATQSDAMMGLGAALGGTGTQMPDWYTNYAQSLMAQDPNPPLPNPPLSPLYGGVSNATSGDMGRYSGPIDGTDQAYQDFLAQQSYAPQMQPEGTRPYGMGGPTPYTIGQPAGQMGGMPQPMQDDQRTPRQPQQQPQMQGGQMMNRPFAVRGR